MVSIKSLEDLAALLRSLYFASISDDRERLLGDAEQACARLVNQNDVSPITLGCIIHDFLYQHRPTGAQTVLRRYRRQLDQIAGFDTGGLLAALESDEPAHLRAVKALYRLKAVNYDYQEGRSDDAFIRAVKRLGLPRNPRILDLGCGTGRTAEWLKKGGFSGHLVGVDVSEAMLAVAAVKGTYRELVCQDIIQFLDRALGRGNDPFDLVVMLWVSVHMRCSDLLAIIAQVPHLLGGPHPCFVFDTYLISGGTSSRRAETGLHSIARTELETALKSAGFAVRSSLSDTLALYSCSLLPGKTVGHVTGIPTEMSAV